MGIITLAHPLTRGSIDRRSCAVGGQAFRCAACTVQIIINGHTCLQGPCRAGPHFMVRTYVLHGGPCAVGTPKVQEHLPESEGRLQFSVAKHEVSFSPAETKQPFTS